MENNPKNSKKLIQISKNRTSLFILLPVFTMMFVTLFSNPVYYSAYGQFSLGGLEYKVEISSDEIFPDEKIKSDVLNNRQPTEYTLPELTYSLLGYKITASDIEVKTETKEIKNTDKLRIDFPVMKATNVKVSNGDLNFDFPNVDLASTYAVYDANLDKFTVHVPISVAAKHLPSALG